MLEFISTVSSLIGTKDNAMCSLLKVWSLRSSVRLNSAVAVKVLGG